MSRTGQLSEVEARFTVGQQVIHDVRNTNKKKLIQTLGFLKDRIVDLKDLYSNLIGNRALINSLVARAEDELREALEATLETLRAVYELQAPGWDELKQKIEVLDLKKERERKERD